MTNTQKPDNQSNTITITLAGGRRNLTIIGKVGHINPNYIVIVDQNGNEIYIPQHAIETMVVK